MDTIIIGNGPAGISAALYTCRANLKTLIIGRDGGSLEKAEKIENYYGFAEPISGTELLDIGISQAKRLGAEIINDEVVGVGYDGQYIIKTNHGEYKAPSMILTTGAKRTIPRIKGLKELEGRGVSYCAECDAFFYRGKDVAVLGHGNYALHEAQVLLPVAKSVTLLTDGKEPKTSVPESIKVNTAKINKINGNNIIDSIEFENAAEQKINGLFVAIGVAGSADLARKLGVTLNGRNIAVNERMATNLPGLYAAGDCTGGMLQIAKAVHEGAIAGREVIKYIKNLKK